MVGFCMRKIYGKFTERVSKIRGSLMDLVLQSVM